MLITKMFTMKIFTRKSVHWKKSLQKTGGMGVGITSGEIAFLGKMPPRKIFTGRNDHSKNMHREKYILEKNPRLVI